METPDNVLFSECCNPRVQCSNKIKNPRTRCCVGQSASSSQSWGLAGTSHVNYPTIKIFRFAENMREATQPSTRGGEDGRNAFFRLHAAEGAEVRVRFRPVRARFVVVSVSLRHLFLKYCGFRTVLILLSSEGQAGEAWEL